MSFESQFAALKELSARLGADPDQIQAGGGNTSLKDGDRLIVKASGKWLDKALVEEIFVCVSISDICRRLQEEGSREKGLKVMAFDLKGRASDLRPSIETAFHALLEDRVVLHTHSTVAISYAILLNGPGFVSEALAGVPWGWVPYVKPGVDLALEVARVARERKAKVIILANHGVIVTGSSVEEAGELLQLVEERLGRAPAANDSAARISVLEALAAQLGKEYEPAREDSWHTLGTSPHCYKLVTGGTLYPDHVIFLGPAAWHLPSGLLLVKDLRNASLMAVADQKPVVLVEGAGCLVRRDLGEAPKALLRCLAAVAARSRPGEPVAYLSAEDESALMNWDAEHYRQKLAAGR